ncbi:VOC family protein [Halomonas sp. HL-93]|uniref:VOC family protein n=1 Tax=Halomonas sp. HL-93 TaxID=1666906 RepID=UPI0006DB82B6|nr:VOC family protein [Halomonas sp. HL-93]KPQ25763.1 MAG: putative lyase [Halomonas sp. HL-93]SBR47231.1 Catechol 2,3-dioxygenase [Halomonas sp. HL-93]
MIAYTMVGTRDLEKALKFYDPLFAEMNLELCWQDESSVSYGKVEDMSFPRFFVGYPFDGKTSSVGNGSMTAFQFHDPGVVDRLYEIAMNHGGNSEGAPGYRPQYAEGFYAAYVRDPEGNKLAFVVYPQE